MRKTTVLRDLLKRPGIIIAPGADNAFTAKIIEQTGGFQAVYMTGSGASANIIGMPDIGMLTMTEMATQAKHLAMATKLPVIADADTGYGNALNVMRTVREYERAGVAGIHIEDQELPKKCGHFEGKRLISQDEMVGKIKAALDASEDPDFVVIARVDARASLGFDEAMNRAQAYVDAGADGIFFEAPQSVEEMRAVPQTIKVPLLVNMVAMGGKTPALTVKELEEMGYKIVIFPLDTQCAAIKAIQEVMLELKAVGSTKGFAKRMITFDEYKSLLGLPEYTEMERKYGAE